MATLQSRKIEPLSCRLWIGLSGFESQSSYYPSADCGQLSALCLSFLSYKMKKMMTSTAGRMKAVIPYSGLGGVPAVPSTQKNAHPIDLELRLREAK